MKNKTQKVHKFVDIINQFLQREEYKTIVKWNDEGTQILLLDKVRFERIVLPQYFRHGNYNSFKRQMNFYNFQQNRNEYGILFFQNPYFKRGKICYQNIKRRKTQKSQLKVLQQESQVLKQTLIDLCSQQQELKTQLLYALQVNQQVRQQLSNSLQVILDVIQIIYNFKNKRKSREIILVILKLFRGMIPEKQYLFSRLINYWFPQEELVAQYNEEVGFQVEESEKNYLDDEMASFDIDNSFQFWNKKKSEGYNAGDNQDEF